MAIFPLQKYKESWISIPFNSLETTALNEIVDKPFHVIRTGFHDMCWKVLFSHLKNNVADWDHLFLQEIPSSYPVLELLPEICRKQNLIYQVEFDSMSTELSVEGNWNDFWLKHKTMRRNVNKLERVFEERLSFTVHDNNWQQCLDQYIELENKTWKKGLGVTKDDETINFYKRFCERLDATGNLKFGFLTVDDQPISAIIAYTHNDTVYFPQGCFDPAYKKYSPNMINISYFLKYFYGTSYKKVDFLCGYADFVNKWSDSEIKTYEVDIYIKRPIVRLVIAEQALIKSIGLLKTILINAYSKLTKK